jgi:hypothetical protein
MTTSYYLGLGVVALLVRPIGRLCEGSVVTFLNLNQNVPRFMSCVMHPARTPYSTRALEDQFGETAPSLNPHNTAFDLQFNTYLLTVNVSPYTNNYLLPLGVDANNRLDATPQR